MNMELFFPWMSRFDACIVKTPERNVILLIENCKSNGKIDALRELMNVEVRCVVGTGHF